MVERRIIEIGVKKFSGTLEQMRRELNSQRLDSNITPKARDERIRITIRTLNNLIDTIEDKKIKRLLTRARQLAQIAHEHTSEIDNYNRMLTEIDKELQVWWTREQGSLREQARDIPLEEGKWHREEYHFHEALAKLGSMIHTLQQQGYRIMHQPRQVFLHGQLSVRHLSVELIKNDIPVTVNIGEFYTHWAQQSPRLKNVKKGEDMVKLEFRQDTSVAHLQLICIKPAKDGWFRYREAVCEIASRVDH